MLRKECLMIYAERAYQAKGAECISARDTPANTSLSIEIATQASGVMTELVYLFILIVGHIENSK